MSPVSLDDGIRFRGRREEAGCSQDFRKAVRRDEGVIQAENVEKLAIPEGEAALRIESEECDREVVLAPDKNRVIKLGGGVTGMFRL